MSGLTQWSSHGDAASQWEDTGQRLGPFLSGCYRHLVRGGPGEAKDTAAHEITPHDSEFSGPNIGSAKAKKP